MSGPEGDDELLKWLAGSLSELSSAIQAGRGAEASALRRKIASDILGRGILLDVGLWLFRKPANVVTDEDARLARALFAAVMEQGEIMRKFQRSARAANQRKRKR